MEIIETFKMPKSNSIDCEDDIIITDGFIAVVDGVTAKTDFKFDGKTPGKLAYELIKESIEQANSTDTCQAIISSCNEKIRDAYKSVDFSEDKGQKGIAASAVIYSNHFREIWMIGDCQVLVDGKLYLNPKKSDIVCAEMRSLILHIRKNNSLDDTKDVGREFVLPWILGATAFANKTDTSYGYSVINGEDIPDELIKKIALDKNAHDIVFSSDGYILLKPTLTETEEVLKQCIIDDYQMYINYPSTKGMVSGQNSFDDRAFIKFKVELQK